MPDEYVQGLMKAGQRLLQSFAGSPGLPNEAGASMADLQMNYFRQQLTLWTQMMAGAGAAGEPVAVADRGDRRFHAAEWRENPAYNLLKQTYLLNSRLISDVVEASDLDEA